MFRTALILATALSAGAAAAQDDASGAGDPSGGGDQSQQSQMITAEMLEEAEIVSLEGQYDEGVWQGGEPLSAVVADLREIGDVEDVILNVEGQMQGLTTDVGGFLGIGSKEVLIPLDDIRVLRPEDGSDDITIITRLNEQQLTDLSAFEMSQ